MTPQTEAGKRVLRLRVLIAGETEERAANAIISVEEAARRAALVDLKAEVEGLPRLWWCPAWGTLNATRYHGNEGPDDPNCGKVSYFNAAAIDRALGE